ncbi:hypothetical protein LH128_11231 [Sphingomonas sp. LH128]|nr:hypothetical protein LH128_11231 [Sphingomonas sp. LH128]
MALAFSLLSSSLPETTKARPQRTGLLLWQKVRIASVGQAALDCFATLAMTRVGETATRVGARNSGEVGW